MARSKIPKTPLMIAAFVMLTLSIALNNIAVAQMESCDQLLTECAMMIEADQKALDKLQEVVELQETQITTQAELLEHEAKRIQNLEKDRNLMRGIAVGELLLLLLLVL